MKLPGWLRESTAGLDRQVIILSTTSLVIMLGSSIISPGLPLYARQFGVSYAGAGLLVSSFALGRLAFDYVGGALADRMSPRLLTTAGALITAAAALLCALASSFTWLVVYRVVEGIGSAFYVITIMALFARTVGAEQMGKAMGFYQSMILLGVSFGPTIGGVVAEIWGLRAPFYVMAMFGLLVAALTWRLVTPDVRAAHEQAVERPALAAVFRHVTSRSFIYVLVLTFYVFAVRAGARSNLIPLFGGERGGLRASAIGVILSASAFANFVVLFHAGALIDRRGRQRVALPTLAMTAAVCFGFAWSPGFVNLLIMSTGLGISLGYLAPAPAAMTADLTPREMLGAVIGVYRMAGDLGLLLGPVALGALATRFGFETAFGVAAVFALGTLAFGFSVSETLGVRTAVDHEALAAANTAASAAD
ncbi:MAG TPA: MFS transporter [Candidatus Binatia bacterium]|nr:MFS transporter [Candidatus Binatia bacterium]